jgi:hypothetical protein
MKGDQFECNKCGKIFLRLCHYIQHSSFGKCNGVFDDDGNNKIIRRDFSDERKTKIQRTIKMNTPIHYEESDVNACNKSMLESLKQSADKQMPKNTTHKNHLHLYNAPTISQRCEVIFQNDNDTSFDPDSDATTHVYNERRILPNTVETVLPPSLKAQIHLANILSMHNVDLSLFNNITDWVKHHSDDGAFNWKDAEWLRRDTLLKRMEKVLNLEGMRPKDVDVHLSSSGTNITVPVFDFTAMALSVLHDPTIMQKCNIIPEYNLHNGLKTNNARNDTFDDFTSGTLYEGARLMYANGVGEMPIPIYVFIDETFTDVYGSLKVAPVIFTFAFFTQECRNNVDFWRPLGFIPNLGYGKSKNDTTTTQMKLQDFHNCLRVIFKSYIDVHLNGGIKTVITDFNGGWKEVTLKSWVHVVIGDTCGNNQICGHYNNNGSGLSMPYRDCMCSGSNMSNPDPMCVYITKEFLKQEELTCDSRSGAMQRISKYKIDNAFDHIPISDDIYGIYRLTPPEGLHVFGNGIYANFFQVIHDILGTNSSGKTDKEEIEVVHNVIASDFCRQSERDFPRRSSRNGPLDGTKMGATERRGNLFAFAITMLTMQGKTLVEEKLRNNSSGRKIEYSKFVETILLTLSFEKWLHEEHLKTEVYNAKPWVVRLKELIKEHLDKESIELKGNGWDTPKFHSLSKFLLYIELLGCATIFFGGPCERALKKIAKKPSQNTQRISNSFVSQISKRNFEGFVLESSYEEVRAECGDPRMTKHAPTTNQSENESNETMEQEDMEDNYYENIDAINHYFEGSYTMVIGEVRRYQQKQFRSVHITWDSKKKNVTSDPISDSLMTVIKTKLTEWNSKQCVVLQGYTMFKKQHNGTEIIYRASEQYRERKWYDFAYIKYDTGIYPAKILGFVKFIGGDVPNNMENNEMYAVVHTSSVSFDRDRLENEFIRGFELGADMKSFDIIPVDSIESPMLAIPNYGHSKITRFITALNYNEWGKYFKRKMTTILAAECSTNNSGLHWKKYIHGSN